MTAGELKFALEVETVLNTIPQPEYRQLVVEVSLVCDTLFHKGAPIQGGSHDRKALKFPYPNGLCLLPLVSSCLLPLCPIVGGLLFPFVPLTSLRYTLFAIIPSSILLTCS